MIQFNAKVNVLRISRIASAMGQTEVSNVLHNNLPCKINWKRGREKLFFNKDTHFCDAKMFCRIVDITNKDRVQYNGKVYEVVDVSNLDEADRLLTVDLRLIE